MKTKSAVLMLLLIASACWAQLPTLKQLQDRADRLIPDKSQLRFQEIPWVHDLAEAQKIAQAEKRPMFLWGYGGRARPDNGLEGC